MFKWQILSNKKLKMFLPVIFGAFLVASCSQVSSTQAAAEKAAKDAKDIEAATLEDAPCLIGLGAWSRMEDLRKRNGVFYTCVSDAERYGVSINE